MGGMRPDSRRMVDLNELYCFELFCKSSKSNVDTFGCEGCKRNSAPHTCPHQTMQCLSVGYMECKTKKEYADSALCRHMHPELCGIGSVAWHLFTRLYYKINSSAYCNVVT